MTKEILVLKSSKCSLTPLKYGIGKLMKVINLIERPFVYTDNDKNKTKHDRSTVLKVLREAGNYLFSI